MKELQQSFGFHQQVILEFLFGSVGRKSSSAQPSLPRSFCVGDWAWEWGLEMQREVPQKT